MMHLIYYADGNTVVMCGFGKVPENHSYLHIAWASDSLIKNENVCIMCHTEWTSTVDNLEGWVRE